MFCYHPFLYKTHYEIACPSVYYILDFPSIFSANTQLFKLNFFGVNDIFRDGEDAELIIFFLSSEIYFFEKGLISMKPECVFVISDALTIFLLSSYF